MKTGKDIILKYCKNVESHSIDHLSHCEDIINVLTNKIDKRCLYDYCPNNYGLDNFIGECDIHEDEGEYCITCWNKALNLQIEEQEKPKTKIIRVTSCGDCPYSEGVLKTDDIEKKQVNDHFFIVTKQRHYTEYFCDENSKRFCGEGNIPNWCPSEDYKN